MAHSDEHQAIDNMVGANLRLQRMAKGMSQEKLGEQLGITFQQVQKYEKGTNRLSASMLVMAARALGIAVVALFNNVPGVSGPGT